jgi:hypothetical protein
LNRLLDQSKEQLASRSGGAAVEPKCEFIQIPVEMIRSDRPLVSAEQPPLQKRYHAVDSREERINRFSFPAFDLPVMNVSLQTHIRIQPIGSHYASRLNRGSYKAVQAVAREIGDMSQPDSTDTPAILLRGYDDERLILGTTAPDAFCRGAPERLVHFHRAMQPIPAGSNHCTAKLVKQRPSSSVTAKSENPLQAECTDTILLTRDMPHRPKPNCQRQAAILKNRSGTNRRLVPTPAAKQQTPAHQPGGTNAATGANKSVRPPQLEQIAPTAIFGRKPSFQFQQRPRVILINHLPTLHLGVG